MKNFKQYLRQTLNEQTYLPSEPIDPLPYPWNTLNCYSSMNGDLHCDMPDGTTNTIPCGVWPAGPCAPIEPKFPYTPPKPRYPNRPLLPAPGYEPNKDTIYQ